MQHANILSVNVQHYVKHHQLKKNFSFTEYVRISCHHLIIDALATYYMTYNGGTCMKVQFILNNSHMYYFSVANISS